jgi:hypothetical protein
LLGSDVDLAPVARQDLGVGRVIDLDHGHTEPAGSGIT